jgi:hypothetical protein
MPGCRPNTPPSALLAFPRRVSFPKARYSQAAAFFQQRSNGTEKPPQRAPHRRAQALRSRMHIPGRRGPNSSSGQSQIGIRAIGVFARTCADCEPTFPAVQAYRDVWGVPGDTNNDRAVQKALTELKAGIEIPNFPGGPV